MSDIPDLERDIARTRADLADTVDQLSARAEQVRSDTTRGAAYVGGAAAALLVVWVVVKRLRSR